MADKDKPCFEFIENKCTRGAKCKFSHDPAVIAAAAAKRNKGVDKASSALAIRERGGKTTVTKTVEEKQIRMPNGDIKIVKSVIEELTFSPYTKHAGNTRVTGPVARDKFGNAHGPEFDLSPDNVFKGQTVAVLNLYHDCCPLTPLPLTSVKAALERKGFSVKIFEGLPTPEDLLKELRRSCQLWVISGHRQQLTAAHLDIIAGHVDRRKGLFIWGDNDPYVADANAILQRLPMTSELTLSGDFLGNTVLAEAERAKDGTSPGFVKHLITTGLEKLFEGSTVASIKGPKDKFRTIIRASDGQPVTAVYGRDNNRIIIDGGFTRLLEEYWDKTSGTARFVTNAACWLYNYEGRVLPMQRERAKAAAAASGGAPGKTPAGGAGGAASKPAGAMPAAKKKTTRCKFFEAGSCKFGDACEFLH